MLPAEAVIVRHGCATDTLDLAGLVWLSVFVPAGTVIERLSVERLFLSLGHLVFTVVVAWALDEEKKRVGGSIVHSSPE